MFDDTAFAPLASARHAYDEAQARCRELGARREALRADYLAALSASQRAGASVTLSGDAALLEKAFARLDSQYQAIRAEHRKAGDTLEIELRTAYGRQHREAAGTAAAAAAALLEALDELERVRQLAAIPGRDPAFAGFLLPAETVRDIHARLTGYSGKSAS